MVVARRALADYDDNDDNDEGDNGTDPIQCAVFLVRIGLLTAVCYHAVYIRLDAVREYGRVIHEFDPWFNYRATEYLVEHDLQSFLTWYDTKVWSPLGRPVGTTIYPGMQMTAALVSWPVKSSPSIH
jgi:dolichyl-diphosphooligosaccharide--protein glycosyltransferase